jgi:RNA polymerase sigma-70 factor (ECF subfamily)
LNESNLQTEKTALEQLIHGDQQAFAFLYHHYVEKVYYFALGLVRSPESAENITQEVFVKLWETRERIETDNSFNGYLFTIARNIIFNQHRKKINELTYLEYLNRAFSDSEAKTEEDLLLSELQEQIHGCIDQLPPQRKKVFEMSRLQGMTYKEISLSLGIAEKTIATHIRLALQSIRKSIRI